ncbi:radical SAM/SPASM domain-containing protein [Rhodococcus phenolicus]|uniref:radical SAM/SPASM domain-containing protein n=1 Tax=Rhodococcus phenolicus TaxID=263849 RepID=UPI00082BB64E|nr:radical SAM protein [Rhodococcus phenolicus]
MARVAERQLPRVSHFTKWIHLAGDRYLLMNHPRNVLMFTSSPLVEALDAGRLDDISADVRNRLLAQGYLTDLAPADEDAWITGRIDDLENYYAAAGEPKNYCFITTYRCNLSCSYCFQSNAEQRIVTNRMLSLADAEAGLQVMENETATVDPGTPRSRVLLFGGEPLLPRQREVVETIVRGCQRLGYSLEATTNGYFLEKFEDLLGPSLIEHLQISLDGPPEIHNTRRIPVNGAPTFDKIWRNIQRALDKGCTISLRCNLDRRNLDGFVKLAEFLEAEGTLDHPGLDLRYSRVVPDFESRDAVADVALDYDELESHLLDAIETHPVLKKVPAPSDIHDLATWMQRRFPTKTSRHCGAVQRNVYFGPDREIYPCHETVGKVELSIGVYRDGEIRYNSSRSKWTDRRPDQLTMCRRCPYILVCAGGCAAHVDLDGEPLQSNCEGFDAKYSLAVQRAYLGDNTGLAEALVAEGC